MTYKAIFFTVPILAALLGVVLLPHTPRIAAQVDCNATPSDPSCQSSPSDNSQPPSNNNNPPADNSQPPQPSTQTCPDGSVIDASATCPTPPPTPPSQPSTQTCPDGSVIDASATCPTPPPPPSQPSTQTGASNNTGNAAGSQVSNNTDFVNTILQIVNRERAAVQVPPLVWSNTLAADAQAWAEHVATINEMVHSPGNFKDYAETIASRGPSGPGTLIPMVESWVAEKSLYHGGPMPVGGGGFTHYTQLVWRTTTQIGCGMATGSDLKYDYLVCRFLPMGNFIGESPY